MDVTTRAGIHAALGDPHRLRMVDELAQSDRTFLELAHLIELPGNAAAHHLEVLEQAGLIERRVSDGDRRRRYIQLRPERLDGLIAVPTRVPRAILFVCTHNSARSQFAAALWRLRTDGRSDSAGTDPAPVVHPLAVQAAAIFGVDLAGAHPKGYAEVAAAPDLIVSVCDRAHEAGIPFDAPIVHWSVPDPVRGGSPDAFRVAFTELAERIDRLASASAQAS